MVSSMRNKATRQRRRMLKHSSHEVSQRYVSLSIVSKWNEYLRIFVFFVIFHRAGSTGADAEPHAMCHGKTSGAKLFPSNLSSPSLAQMCSDRTPIAVETTIDHKPERTKRFTGTVQWRSTPANRILTCYLLLQRANDQQVSGAAHTNWSNLVGDCSNGKRCCKMV